jgi:uncharacterized membrane protein YqaE (UPF0057 family)
MAKKNLLLLIIVSIILPPLAVLIDKGFGKDFIINIVLTLLFFIPGLVHALWLVTK